MLKGCDIYNEFHPDIIIGIGGGSVIDMSKLINQISMHSCSHSSDQISIIIKNKAFPFKKGIPLIAIPTTSGTGSQVTHFAVIYIDDIKYSLADQSILPDYAIVDPVLSYTVPSKIVAATGMDALSQAVESYWSIRSTEESKMYSSKAIALILNSLDAAVSGDNHAKDEMSQAAHLAGKAINITTTTAPHAISYPITKVYGVQHGYAVALTLGRFFEINSDFKCNVVIDPRGEGYLKGVMTELFKMFNVSSAGECEAVWYQLMKKIGLNPDVNMVVKCEDIHRLIEEVNLDRLNNHPVKITADHLEDILCPV